MNIKKYEQTVNGALRRIARHRRCAKCLLLALFAPFAVFSTTLCDNGLTDYIDYYGDDGKQHLHCQFQIFHYTDEYCNWYERKGDYDGSVEYFYATNSIGLYGAKWRIPGEYYLGIGSNYHGTKLASYSSIEKPDWIDVADDSLSGGTTEKNFVIGKNKSWKRRRAFVIVQHNYYDCDAYRGSYACSKNLIEQRGILNYEGDETDVHSAVEINFSSNSVLKVDGEVVIDCDKDGLFLPLGVNPKNRAPEMEY